MASLLPQSSSPLETAAAQALADIEGVPIPLTQLWNPNTCPAPLLPYLAWTLSVDRWDSTWSEQTKRAVITASFGVHRKKGTIAALRQVVEPLGYLLKIEEWWQKYPEGVPGTFSMDIGLRDTGITERTFEELERLIDDAKPLSRHLVELTIILESRGSFFIGSSSYSGEQITVYPYPSGPIETDGSAYFGTGHFLIDTVSVNHG